ncbi:GLPGLI family protein [Sphingobacterium sp. UDSM-2020]|uniref:GLPGLI family protein n=1 Tax=Sphingobacterium sp. UDSM-2020 TaxID=2795738 RepID=UPI001936EF0B|nr:GLPGLI family protein [Sphingobacterium sp. UDSM-2020]QQD13462.1 GLPGLI family protein [Sphingobacterium sp. UDSM-2020]
MIRNVILLLLAVSGSLTSKAQQLMASYEYIPSPVATFKEDVYYDGTVKIAVRDSISLKKETTTGQSEDEMESSELSVVLDAGKIFRKIVIQDPKQKGLIETRSLDSKNYLVEDHTFKAINWNTDYPEEEKFGNKMCKKATADYRGTKVVAYYDPSIPVPAGPYKFGGLPGLIVMLYTESAHPHYWLLKKVSYPFEGQIPVDRNYIQTLPKMSLKKYVEQHERKIAEQMRIMRSKLPEGVEFSTENKTKTRGTVEQVYEWEHGSN